MLNSTEKILSSELSKHAFHDVDLVHLFKGSNARRYGLVNKSLKKGEIIQVRRGLYTLAPKYLTEYFSLYYLANHIVPFSYVTCEAALHYYQWIPERVTQISCLAAFGRNRVFDTDFAQFIYHVHPIDKQKFFWGVEQIKINDKLVLMASPLRALMDYVYWYKIKRADWGFLQESLRIENHHLQTINKLEIEKLNSVYHSIYVKDFLRNLLKGHNGAK